MHIHTVKEGESVFAIAKQYAVSPMSIIENNGLENPDSLTVGEELLVLTPSRTYVARNGDTVSSIARRFGIRKSELYANNPALMGKEGVYDGQLLALKYGDARLGMGASNGYFFKGCSEAALCRALPYLTYVTVGAVIARDGRFSSIFNHKDIAQKIRAEGKIPMLRIYDENSTDFYDNREALCPYYDTIINYAKKYGFAGITLSVPKEEVNVHSYESFIIELRRRLIGCDLILFTEAVVGREHGYADYADGCILSYDKMTLSDIPNFENGEKAAYTEYSEASESSKTFMDIPSFALTSDGYVDYKEAVRAAAKLGVHIERDDTTGVCSYSYNGKRGEPHTVRFESLNNVKAKLSLLGELGFMGISFDIMRCPTEHLMMYNALFSGICYASVFANGEILHDSDAPLS